MAHFRMREDCKTWFKNITKTGSGKPGLTLDFDAYFICMLLGLATGRRSSPTDHGKKMSDLIERFPEAYRSQQRLVAGLLIWAELARRGIDIKEKQGVQDVVVELLSSQNFTGLSNEGINLLDKYASGGFDVLTDKYEQKPDRFEQFIREFASEFQNAVDHSVWGT